MIIFSGSSSFDISLEKKVYTNIKQWYKEKFADPPYGQKDGDYFVRCNNVELADTYITTKGTRLVKIYPRNDKYHHTFKYIVIDHDKGDMSPQDAHIRLKRLNLNHIIYNTHSAYIGNNNHRWRAIIPCDVTYLVKYLKATVENLPFETTVTEKVNSQAFFYPRLNSACQREYYSILYNKGNDLKVDTTEDTYYGRNISDDDIDEIEALDALSREDRIEGLRDLIKRDKIGNRDNAITRYSIYRAWDGASRRKVISECLELTKHYTGKEAGYFKNRIRNGVYIDSALGKIKENRRRILDKQFTTPLEEMGEEITSHIKYTKLPPIEFDGLFKDLVEIWDKFDRRSVRELSILGSLIATSICCGRAVHCGTHTLGLRVIGYGNPSIGKTKQLSYVNDLLTEVSASLTGNVKHKFTFRVLPGMYSEVKLVKESIRNASVTLIDTEQGIRESNELGNIKGIKSILMDTYGLKPNQPIPYTGSTEISIPIYGTQFNSIKISTPKSEMRSIMDGTGEDSRILYFLLKPEPRNMKREILEEFPNDIIDKLSMIVYRCFFDEEINLSHKIDNKKPLIGACLGKKKTMYNFELDTESKQIIEDVEILRDAIINGEISVSSVEEDAISKRVQKYVKVALAISAANELYKENPDLTIKGEVMKYAKAVVDMTDFASRESIKKVIKGNPIDRSVDLLRKELTNLFINRSNGDINTKFKFVNEGIFLFYDIYKKLGINWDVELNYAKDNRICFNENTYDYIYKVCKYGEEQGWLKVLDKFNPLHPSKSNSSRWAIAIRTRA